MFYVISESRGLMATSNDASHAEELCLAVAVATGRTVYLHDTEAP